VDVVRGRVVFQATKNGETRGVALTGPALEAMSRLAKVRRIDSGLCFPRADGTAPVDVRYAWKMALQEAGITGFRFHDLRHTFASYVAMQGASLVELAEVLGHKTLAMVKRYVHLTESHTTAVVSRMTADKFG
jgi:integrase